MSIADKHRPARGFDTAQVQVRRRGSSTDLGGELRKLVLERRRARGLRGGLLARGLALGQQRAVLLAQAAVRLDLGRQPLVLVRQVLDLLCGTGPTYSASGHR